jgi:hypothetical protein
MCSIEGGSAEIDHNTCPALKNGSCAAFGNGNCWNINYDFSCEEKTSAPICNGEQRCPLDSENPDTKTFIGLTPQQVAILEGYGSCPINYDINQTDPWTASNPPNCSCCDPATGDMSGCGGNDGSGGNEGGE